jgi:hypothetical protein
MNKRLPFRAWFYFRQGWTTYFAFVFAAINTLTVTYYLAIDQYSFLTAIFPSFIQYVLVFVIIGVPILITIGYLHWKKTSAYRSEADIWIESNPYMRRMLVNTEKILPLQIKLAEMLLKLSNNEKLTQVEITEISKIKNDLSDYSNLKTSDKRDQLEDSTYDKLKDFK